MSGKPASEPIRHRVAGASYDAAECRSQMDVLRLVARDLFPEIGGGDPFALVPRPPIGRDPLDFFVFGADR